MYEHERKFLVEDLSVLRGSTGVKVEQVYLWAERGWSIRVRRTQVPVPDEGEDDAPAMLTLKGPRENSSRPEYEMEIDPLVASSLMLLSPRRIVKLRHPVISSGSAWVVDVFLGENKGLAVAELEMENPHELATIKAPWWAGREVTLDTRYDNLNLALAPFSTWETEADRRIPGA